jgi:hypothetical protein
MKKLIYPILALTFFFISTNAQELEEKKFGISFSGFVKNDFILDSRQIVAARQGHFLLYPANEVIDPDGNDINAQGTFNYLAIQSRLTGKITGPDAFGAKTSGVIEGAFFGQNETNINSFRLRHAFLKLNWSTTEILMGQYWHILFNPDCFPGTVSFNTGVPFQFFSRNPQIRITQDMGSISLTGVVGTQLDFVSPGGSSELRNALLPELGGSLAYTNSIIHTGLTAGYKQLRPRIATESDPSYQTKATVGGFTGQAFLKITTKPITAKAEVLYAQNGYDGLMLGGYAVQSITDAVRDFREYTTVNVMSVWGDIHTNGEKIQGGLFMGYTQNFGTYEEIEAMALYGQYVRGSDIGHIFRLAPRLIFNSGKVRIAGEYELTGAAYGSSTDSFGIPQDLNTVMNHRVLVAVFYFF